MQPQRFYFSVLGTAFLRRSTASSNLVNGSFHLSHPVFDHRRYAHEQTTTFANDGIIQQVKVANLSFNGISKIRLVRSSAGWRSVPVNFDPPQKKLRNGSEVSKCNPNDVFPLLKTAIDMRVTNVRTLRAKLGSKERWFAQKMNKTKSSRSVTEETSPVFQETHSFIDTETKLCLVRTPKEGQALGEARHTLKDQVINGVEAQLDGFLQDCATTKLMGTVRGNASKRKPNKTERYRARRRMISQQTVKAAEQLEMIKEQLEMMGRPLDMARRRLQNCKRLKLVKKQPGMKQGQLEATSINLEMVRARLEASKQQCVAETQLDVLERPLDIIENPSKIIRSATENWNQMDALDRQLTIIEIQLNMIEKLPEIIEMRLKIVRRQLNMVGRHLEVAKRRIEAWNQLDMVERQLKIAENQLQTIERRVETASRKMNLPTAQREGTISTARVAMEVPLKPPRSPSAMLAHWLDTTDISERERYWLKYKAIFSPSLPLILLAHLQQATNPSIGQENFNVSYLPASSARFLQRRGFAMTDVVEWAWIISTQDVKVMIERFISTPTKKPNFLLLEILRRDISCVRSFKFLLIHSWDQLLQRPRRSLVTKSEVEINSIILRSETASLTEKDLSSCWHSTMHEMTFLNIFRRLLYHARRIWPPAIVNVSHMVAPFIYYKFHIDSSERAKLDNQTHSRLSKLYNQMLHSLSLPASINPLKSMVHNWQAQRAILEMTTRFKPALLLDQNSYRAVCQVLAASKKSEIESRAASLRTRSWPPWRIEQDGMDAQRLPEDDISRVVATTIQAKESGYSDDARDLVLRVLGGQEPDGTPTIPTRKLIKLRSRRPEKSCVTTKDDMEANVWAARIESTRDVQEAWSAFTSYQAQGCQPNMSMYFAMIAKLQFEGARCGRAFQHSPSPGDGKEVVPPSTDNFSSFYQSRLQPPTSSELYKQMILGGIRPSGRFLAFLVRHARTPDEGLYFLRDSRISRRAVAFLQGFKAINPAVLKKVPNPVLAAFISLLCRFAPRVIPPTVNSTHLNDKDEAENTRSTTEHDGPVKTEWEILDLPMYCDRRRLDLLLHCSNLLQISQTKYRPAWYAFFSGLARRGVIVDRSLTGDPKNDILTWKILVAGLGDFHKCGLELDPHGFLILCRGFEKALLASFKIPKDEREDIFGSCQTRIVVNEFMRLAETSGTQRPTMPTLLHPIEGAQLHAYVRILGLDADYDGLMYVLRWMVEQYDALDQIKAQSRNGSKLIRRTIVAMKVFFARTKYEAEAEELVNSVKGWDGWPGDSEADGYIHHSPGWFDGNDTETEDQAM